MSDDPIPSDISGTNHNWRRDITDLFYGGYKGTRFFCRHCGHVFVHLYDEMPDIHEAMQIMEVPTECVPK